MLAINPKLNKSPTKNGVVHMRPSIRNELMANTIVLMNIDVVPKTTPLQLAEKFASAA